VPPAPVIIVSYKRPETPPVKQPHSGATGAGRTDDVVDRGFAVRIFSPRRCRQIDQRVGKTAIPTRIEIVKAAADREAALRACGATCGLLRRSSKF
jgi:hypothetical protein